MAYVKAKTIHGKRYLYLVESYRKNGKVKKRTVRYLGKAESQRIPEKLAEVKRLDAEERKKAAVTAKPGSQLTLW